MLEAGDFPIQGRGVVLVPFRDEDVTPAYLGWLADPEVVRFSNQRFRTHDADSCRRYLASFAGTDNLFLSIRRDPQGDAIGTMTAYVQRPHGTADIGIMVGARAAWGRGYGQAAWDALLARLLADPRIRKVTGGTLSCNRAMVRIMERAGMTHEATRRAQEIVEGRPEDVVHYARFADR
ncbi:GNAT family N-acetyltransferase [Salinarimonas chemoclinalis]|uniref:GNAT family N-acetyltransferase n=1 Tax=Salinarimonas chemoclinalis TaxID=3241599 RepID=UPI003556AFFF